MVNTQQFISVVPCFFLFSWRSPSQDFGGVFAPGWVLHELQPLRTSLLHQECLLPSKRPSSVMSPTKSPSTFLLLFLQTCLFTYLLMAHFLSVFLCLLSHFLFLCLLPPAAAILSQAHLSRGTSCSSGRLNIWGTMGCCHPGHLEPLWLAQGSSWPPSTQTFCSLCYQTQPFIPNTETWKLKWCIFWMLHLLCFHNPIDTCMNADFVYNLYENWAQIHFIISLLCCSYPVYTNI